jgi:hypothetical protein
MSKTFRQTRRWLVFLTPFLVAVVAWAQNPNSQIGRELAIPVHLQDGEEFNTPVTQLIRYGAQLFNAKFTIQEGAGRPLSKGTDACSPQKSVRAGSWADVTLHRNCVLIFDFCGAQPFYNALIRHVAGDHSAGGKSDSHLDHTVAKEGSLKPSGCPVDDD